MNIIDWLLNLAGVFLWIDWRSGRTGRPQSALSIASALRPTNRGPGRGLGSLAALAAILLVRPLFYHSVGPAVNWAASINFLAISIPWRSDLLGRMYLFSFISFAVALGFYYTWLLLLAAVNRPTGTVAREEVMPRFICGQLGWLDKIPWWLKIFTPSIVAALGWMLLALLLVEIGLLPVMQSPDALRGQAGAFAVAALLTWKWLLIFIFLVHLLNLYVYLGTHPLWPYLSAAARTLLLPLSFLRVGKVDLSPIIGIALVFALTELFLKPLVIDIFRRHIV
ncbi:MAG: hypothetical protein ACXW32_05405 [Limisphaerales bacterium]